MVSREHKRPLLAFVAVAVVCCFLLLNAAGGSAGTGDELPAIQPVMAPQGAGDESPEPSPSGQAPGATVNLPR